MHRSKLTICMQKIFNLRIRFRSTKLTRCLNGVVWYSFVIKETIGVINQIKEKLYKDYERSYVCLWFMGTLPGSPSWVGQCNPSCQSPETMRKSWSIPLLESGRQEINLTAKTLHLM